MSTRCCIGIDWGTHSSKICVADPGEKYLVAPLLSSDLLRQGDCLVFSPAGHSNEEDVVRRLKRDLIEHSLSIPFWGKDDRPDSGTSLGEAVVFSLTCLIAEGRRLASARGARDFTETEVGFSFPNWLAEETRQAAIAVTSFCQAVQAAVHIAVEERTEDLPAAGVPFPIRRLKESVAAAMGAVSDGKKRQLTMESANQTAFRLASRGPEWRFIVESGAAGLPYLRGMKFHQRPGIAGLAKLLVVDAGAGSTDVGYMLKTSHIETGKPAFYYLPPASSFPEAGNALTGEIVKYYRAQNKPVTWTEAEAQKTSQTAWHKLPFVQLWIRHICDHVAQYVQGVPDERWLPFPVTLHLVVTGGSSLVPGLKEALQESVIGALRSRGFAERTCNAVDVVDRYEPRFTFRVEAEVARRAVCFGAADPDKPGFRYTAKMDPPAQPVRMVQRRWV
jgi:hypothetical protein